MGVGAGEVGPGISGRGGGAIGGLLAATPNPAGQALVNGTPTLLSWTAPNDGLIHRVLGIFSLVVTVLEVGGQILLAWTFDGQALTSQLAAGGSTANVVQLTFGKFIDPGTVISVNQNTALTAGTAVANIELYGS